MRPLVILLFTLLGLQGQVPRPTEVQERRLSNGIRVLWVERRNLTAFHATMAFRGGRAEEPVAGATDLLAGALFGASQPEDVEIGKASKEWDTLLAQEEGLQEALRLARLQPSSGSLSQTSGLEAGLQAVKARIQAHRSSTPLSDVYGALGGWQRAETTEDSLMVHTELPQEAFETWCRTEAQRLSILRLSRFSSAKELVLAEARASGSKPLSLLREAALPSHPYGRNLRDHLPALEALRSSELRAYARRALSPDRMALIVVSGLDLNRLLPVLERHFGSLPTPPGPEASLLPEVPPDLGDRRVQASLGSASCLLVGWRTPPRRQLDHLALRLAAQILGGGRHSRLQTRLVGGKALAQRVELRMDVPGARFAGLLVAELFPAKGHSLEELEGALQNEVLRLQQEPISSEEWQRASAQLEVDYLLTLDEPAKLAAALGRSWAECGDWRQLDLEMQRLKALSPEAVQAAVRTWLIPSHRTTVLLQPAVVNTGDPLEARAARVLQGLAALRVEDLAQREHLVTEGLRQLRMLNPQERLRTVELLEAQLLPGKQ